MLVTICTATYHPAKTKTNMQLTITSRDLKMNTISPANNALELFSIYLYRVSSYEINHLIT